MKQKALQIFLAGVDNVLPNKLVNKVFSRKDFQLDKFNNIYLLAFGKASFLMAKEAENILGERIVDGVVITTYGNGGKLDKLKVIEAGHPIPDNNGLKATKLVLNIADKAQENDLVLCLISGGSSALLADYPTDATINYLKKASELLINSGASISEINCVRKHLSSVKGGQLAKAIYPASTISLILSDVVGDKLDVIASGITAPDCTTFSDAIQVLKKYNLIETFPSVFINHLRKGMAGIIDETAKPDDIVFNKVENLIIGSNKIALDGAAEKAKELGFETYLITDRLEGDYKYVADFIFKTINSKKTERHSYKIR
jgi:glycerate 2-kinase